MDGNGLPFLSTTVCEARVQPPISSFPKTELVVYYRHVSDEEAEHRGFSTIARSHSK